MLYHFNCDFLIIFHVDALFYLNFIINKIVKSFQNEVLGFISRDFYFIPWYISPNAPLPNFLFIEILNEFPSKIKKMNSQNIGPLVKGSESEKTTPMIYFHENKIPLGLQLLGYEDIFRKYLQISEFSNPPSNIMKNFQINKIPSAVFLIKDQEKKGDK